jgi:hypothetical protein
MAFAVAPQVARYIRTYIDDVVRAETVETQANQVHRNRLSRGGVDDKVGILPGAYACVGSPSSNHHTLATGATASSVADLANLDGHRP